MMVMIDGGDDGDLQVDSLGWKQIFGRNPSQACPRQKQHVKETG